MRYFALAVPRYIRNARLFYLRPEFIIGSIWNKPEGQGNASVYDVLLLPEPELIRAKLNLGTVNTGSHDLQRDKIIPAYIPQHIREIVIPAATSSPYEWAVNEAARLFNIESNQRLGGEEDQAENFRRNATRTQSHGKDVEEAYSLLECTAEMSDGEIKQHYHLLIRRFHPDMLAAQNLSADQLAQANEMMKKLNLAYDKISKLRGMK